MEKYENICVLSLVHPGSRAKVTGPKCSPWIESTRFIGSSYVNRQSDLFQIRHAGVYAGNCLHSNSGKHTFHVGIGSWKIHSELGENRRDEKNREESWNRQTMTRNTTYNFACRPNISSAMKGQQISFEINGFSTSCINNETVGSFVRRRKYYHKMSCSIILNGKNGRIKLILNRILIWAQKSYSTIFTWTKN